MAGFLWNAVLGVDLQVLLVMAPIVVLASFIYQAAGFGAGLVAVPIAAVFLDLRFVLPVLALLELVNALRLVSLNHRQALPGEALPLIVLSAIGTVIGVRLLVGLPIGWLMIGMGIFVALFLARQLRGPTQRPRAISRLWSLPVGLVSGLGSSMFGMGGPPYLIYLQLRALPFTTWRATFVIVGLFSLIWRVGGFTLAGLYAKPGVLVTSACLIPCALLAMWLAAKSGRFLDEKILRRLVYGLLGLASITLIVKGTANL